MPCSASLVANAAVNPTASKLECTVKVIKLNNALLSSPACCAFSASNTNVNPSGSRKVAIGSKDK
ncbi:Uncharacterised protein [Vibrio cholerae]|nr:Uncharacterised protein [Vibrio cholerae]